MKAILTSLVFVLVLPSFVLSLPAERRADDGQLTAIQALNFALSLEHFQYYFYKRLGRYEPQDFSNAALPPWAQGRYEQISTHESMHTQFLENILGDNAVQPCTYNFPDTDPKSFVKTSNIVEAIASSAYTGLISYLSDAEYIIAISSIHSMEARHSAWINADLRTGAAWSPDFEAPLSLSQAYTLMSAFIDVCPSSNSLLLPPVKVFSALTFSPDARPGQTVRVTFKREATMTPTREHDSSSHTLYAWFISGLKALVVPLIVPLDDDDGDVTVTLTIPDSLQGFVSSVITNDKESASDDATVAGPVFLVFDYDYQGHDQALPM